MGPLLKKIPYVGPIVSSVGLVLDVKDIVKSLTPVGAVSTIGYRFLKECTPPELFIAGKCVMLISGVIVTVGTGGNPIAISGTLSAARSIVKDI